MMESPKKRGRMCVCLALFMPVVFCLRFKSTLLAILHNLCVSVGGDPLPFYMLLLPSFILLIILVNAGLFKSNVADTMTNKKYSEFQIVAVPPKSNAQEIKEENALNGDGSLCDKEPKFCAYMQLDDGEDEDINQFHKRVEAYIHKVQVGFCTEHKSLSLV